MRVRNFELYQFKVVRKFKKYKVKHLNCQFYLSHKILACITDRSVTENIWLAWLTAHAKQNMSGKIY